MRSTIPIALTALLLAGCGSALDYTLAKTDGQDCQWLRLFADQELCHAYVAASPPPPPAPLYCYRTLGDVACYAAPLDGKTQINSG